jgi:tetratricopeptide (TPR) repeat protein
MLAGWCCRLKHLGLLFATRCARQAAGRSRLAACAPRRAWTRAALTAALFAFYMPGAIHAAPRDYTEGNQAYAAGHFDAAKKLYESVVASGTYSANLFLNLGNADYRLGEPGSAMLNYERALALEPQHPEAKANLAFLRERTGAKLEPRSRLESLFEPFSPSTFVWIAAVSIWVALFSITAATLGKTGRAGHVVRALLAALACGYGLHGVVRSRGFESLAVVVAKQTNGRLAPAESAAAQLALPAGSHVHVIEDRGAWLYCTLPDGSRAWVESKAVERVKIIRSA